ncbi:MAG: nuclease SbcCD subunit C [Kofleriaceae bacterium]|nr:nuclease SbcCD subunit C [Kofleriaceae bacterium]
MTQLGTAEQSATTIAALAEAIGSHDGKIFRAFAQGLTLDALLEQANYHLLGLAPRYALERVPAQDLEVQVIDRDMGDEIRGVASLSGGESFLISLALALGLSALAAHSVRVQSLFIDEGFGTLDPATLDTALAVLDALQSSGRQVGIISHVPAIAERVGATIRIVNLGAGRSRVRIDTFNDAE